MPELALVLEGVGKRMQGRMVLKDMSAVFRLGEVTLIRGVRGSGKSVLARLVAGQILADAGTLWRLGPAAPLIGSNWGFLSDGPAIAGLDLRAASYGVDTRDYVDLLADLIEDPDSLRLPLARMRGRDRQTLLYASAWAIPSTLYVADGALSPSDPEVAERIRPLIDAARARAAIVWIADEKVRSDRFGPNAAMWLEHGSLIADGRAPPGGGALR